MSAASPHCRSWLWGRTDGARRKSAAAGPASSTSPDYACAQSRLRTALFRAAVNPGAQKYSALPNFGFVVYVRPSRFILEGRSRRRLDREPGLRWTRQRRARMVAGRAGSPCEPVAARGRTALSGFVSLASPGNVDKARKQCPRQRAARTAKPCGPGRRCYGQAVRGDVREPNRADGIIQFARRGRPEGNRLPGEHGISCPTTAQGRPCVGLHLYAAVRFFCVCLLRSRPRVPPAPGLPCALLDLRAVR
jgi:hypothetical protein